MPVYEFRCELCGERFGKLVQSSGQAPAGVNCPACQSGSVQRLISVPAIHTGGTRHRTGTETAPADKPPILGRKVLHEALKNKR